jgi:hypothetical protein
LHGAPEPLIRLGWRLEPGQEVGIGFGTDRHDRAVEQCLFGCPARRIEDKIRPVLAPHLSGTVD